MNHDEYIKRRDEILYKLQDNVGRVPHTHEARQAIDQLVLDVIGEDTKTKIFELLMELTWMKEPNGLDELRSNKEFEAHKLTELIETHLRQIVRGDE